MYVLSTIYYTFDFNFIQRFGKGVIDNELDFVRLMAWCLLDSEPSLGPMMAKNCVTVLRHWVTLGY